MGVNPPARAESAARTFGPKRYWCSESFTNAIFPCATALTLELASTNVRANRKRIFFISVKGFLTHHRADFTTNNLALASMRQH